MTTLSTPASPFAASRVSFGGVIAAESIKLRTVRSTLWTILIVVALGVGIATLAIVALSGDKQLVTPTAGDTGAGVLITSTAVSAGLRFAQLAVAVLGVLSIASEYGTGMIRSTFAAVPRRVPVLTAKAIALFTLSFVVGLITTVLSWAVGFIVTSAAGKAIDPGKDLDTILWSIVGTSAFLGFVAVLSLGIGAIIRNSAGGIAAAVGLLFVLPLVFDILQSLLRADWVKTVTSYLFTSGGIGMSGAPNGDLSDWASVAVVVVWALVVFVAASIATTVRDL
jgi:ABC-2 type transport system permease protein